MSSFLIAPSILSANLARLGEEVQSVLDAGADMIHIDVMDNHYVPNLTFGPVICESLRNYGITAPFDVHLMIEPVDDIIPAFAKSKVNMITFHPEATKHIHRTIQLIHSFGIKAGLALNPATPLSHLDHVIHDLDMILLMSVNPGFGGQEFIPETIEKIGETRKLIDHSNKKIRLEVDGGINQQNIKKIAQAGADTFVLGTAIFKTPDYKDTITALHKALNDVSK